MKTILVDAINSFIEKETYPNRKIILTGANDEQIEKFGLKDMPYELFTLKHDPEKTDPEYYKRMLAHFDLESGDVVYFEHSEEAKKSAESVGITTYFYDKDAKDLDSLKAFLDADLNP
ncbi:MAG: hypothetical protein ACOCXP_01050 [Candidatus Dojkabacteria bacterium]